MEKNEFIRKLEGATQQAAEAMKDAMTHNDMARFQSTAEGWRQSQETWLQATQGMGPEKARAVMVGFATGGEMAKWQTQRSPGPPPSVFSLYKKKED